MWLLLALGLVALVASHASARSFGGNVSDPEYPLSKWELVVIPAAFGHNIPIELAMKWMDIESGGSPCAIGRSDQFGPDGKLPREIGLGQAYNSADDGGDFTHIPGMVPAAKLRAYCSGGHRTRLLTSDEMLDQVNNLMLLIDHCRTAASHSAVDNKLRWPASGQDMWRLAKAYHALPSILTHGMPAVSAKLGRAPTDWFEFRRTLGMEGNDQWKRSLDNAEETGGVVRGQAVS